MPVLGLIRSEAPGRLQWAILQGLDAFLPIGATANPNLALLLGFACVAKRAEARRREAVGTRRVSVRLELLHVVLAIIRGEDIDEPRALKELPAYAMTKCLALEDAAALYLSRPEKWSPAFFWPP